MIISRELFLAMFQLSETVTGSKYINRQERQIICSLAKHIKAETVIEFGVQDGHTALNLYQNIPSIKRYIGIDLPPDKDIFLDSQKEQKPVQPGILSDGMNGFEVLLADSNTLTKNDLPEADFIFIDGGHDFNTVKHDSELSFELIKDGGVIVWHDYNSIPEVGVRDYINGLCQTGKGDINLLISGTWIVYRFCYK